ncbi:TPA: hypothetical protein LZ311_005013 [Enterobacter asburiae]|nr:hypothetical protein [Enterobacter asburiae]
MCKPHASEARRPEAGSRAVGVRDVEGWRMPVPSGMSGQRTWRSLGREAETHAKAMRNTQNLPISPILAKLD